jgi:hypothetical protein
LHSAVELAEIARTGPVPPFVSAVSKRQLREVARELAAKEREAFVILVPFVAIRRAYFTRLVFLFTKSIMTYSAS